MSTDHGLTIAHLAQAVRALSDGMASLEEIESQLREVRSDILRLTNKLDNQ
jgi:hypothetical protein